MGRMFRIITDGSLDHPNGGSSAVAVPDSEPFVRTGAPFIEVGGPNGPVHSLPKADRPQPPAPNPRPAADEYLSVTLHAIAPPPAGPLPNAVDADLVAFHYPDHPVSGEYRGLRDDIRAQIGDAGPKAVLFTGTALGRGTTTVLLNLAVTLAAEPGTRVLAVDADFTQPGAARKLGLADVPGLAEVLNQVTPLAWALQPTAVPRLQLLAAGKPDDTTPFAMASDFPKLIGQLRQWFDWVLIDGGMWGDLPDRDALSTAFDAVYLVTRDGDRDDSAVVASREEIARRGGLLRGYISTKM